MKAPNFLAFLALASVPGAQADSAPATPQENRSGNAGYTRHAMTDD
jgi:hypothetical protein